MSLPLLRPASIVHLSRRTSHSQATSPPPPAVTVNTPDLFVEREKATNHMALSDGEQRRCRVAGLGDAAPWAAQGSVILLSFVFICLLFRKGRLGYYRMDRRIPGHLSQQELHGVCAQLTLLLALAPLGCARPCLLLLLPNARCGAACCLAGAGLRETLYQPPYILGVPPAWLQVATNDPTYDKQLSNWDYWQPISWEFLPGQVYSEDRFVRSMHFVRLGGSLMFLLGKRP